MAVIKRLLDIFLATVGILLTLPLLPVIALFIKLDSKGPILYPCDRVGKGRVPFKMVKFRTMIEIPVQVGTSLSPRGDVRVTDFGRFLRKTKLNELPQFINILKGEMSFVGPRPEAPDLAELYPAEAEVLFSVKPGLVGPSQVKHRNEEDLFPQGVDPKEYYIRHILPEKLETDLQYVRRPTLFLDIKYIVLAIVCTICGAINCRHIFDNWSQIGMFVADILFVAVSLVFAFAIRFEGIIPTEAFAVILRVLPLLLFYRVICFMGFGLYGVLIRYLDYKSYANVVKAVTLSSILFALTLFGFQIAAFPRSVLAIDWLCLNFLMIFARRPGKAIRDKIYGKISEDEKRVLIYGAGDKGSLAALELQGKAKIVGFLDDDHKKRNKKIQEFKILGNRYDIGPLSKIYKINEVVVAVSNMGVQDLDHIMDFCQKSGVNCSLFTTLADSHLDHVREEELRSRKVAAWAGCRDTQVNLGLVNDVLSQKRILLIGASNAMGVELIRSLSCLDTKEIIILDRYESHLNESFAQSLAFFDRGKVKPYLSPENLAVAAEEILSEGHPPGIIIHMGTRKYSSPILVDPLLVVQENILNTWNLLQLARRKGVQLFLMISAAGAGSPGNFVLSTLRLTEQYVQDDETDGRTSTAIARLLNVVENRGTVVSRIENQIRGQTKIILNHPAEERYFSSTSSAAKLILLAASMSLAKGEGNRGIFMSSPDGRVRIVDLAKSMAKDYGLDPERDIDIEYILSENSVEWKDEIRLDGNRVEKTPYENIIQVIPPRCFESREISEDIESFQRLIGERNREGIIRLVQERMKRIDERVRAIDAMGSAEEVTQSSLPATHR